MFVGLTAIIAMGVAYHFYTVNGLEKENAQQALDLVAYEQQVTTMQVAAEINVNTIAEMATHAADQNSQITLLTESSNEIAEDRDAYMSRFRDHDLTNLARGRPDTIQRLINSATEEVFTDIECTVNKNCDEED